MPCKLSIEEGGWCQFEGSVGDEVTLVTRGTHGVVRFAAVRYNGVDLPITRIDVGKERLSSTTFTVVEERKLILAVYAFSLGASGRGELLEHCGGASIQVLDSGLRGDNEARAHRLCGR